MASPAWSCVRPVSVRPFTLSRWASAARKKPPETSSPSPAHALGGGGQRVVDAGVAGLGGGDEDRLGGDHLAVVAADALLGAVVEGLEVDDLVLAGREPLALPGGQVARAAVDGELHVALRLHLEREVRLVHGDHAEVDRGAVAGVDAHGHAVEAHLRQADLVAARAHLQVHRGRADALAVDLDLHGGRLGVELERRCRVLHGHVDAERAVLDHLDGPRVDALAHRGDVEAVAAAGQPQRGRPHAAQHAVDAHLRVHRRPYLHGGAGELHHRERLLVEPEREHLADRVGQPRRAQHHQVLPHAQPRQRERHRAHVLAVDPDLAHVGVGLHGEGHARQHVGVRLQEGEDGRGGEHEARARAVGGQHQADDLARPAQNRAAHHLRVELEGRGEDAVVEHAAAHDLGRGDAGKGEQRPQRRAQEVGVRGLRRGDAVGRELGVGHGRQPVQLEQGQPQRLVHGHHPGAGVEAIGEADAELGLAARRARGRGDDAGLGEHHARGPHVVADLHHRLRRRGVEPLEHVGRSGRVHLRRGHGQHGRGPGHVRGRGERRCHQRSRERGEEAHGAGSGLRMVVQPSSSTGGPDTRK